MLDFKGRAKFDAWEQRKGLAHAAAPNAYVDLVANLEARYGLRSQLNGSCPDIVCDTEAVYPRHPKPMPSRSSPICVIRRRRDKNQHLR